MDPQVSYFLRIDANIPHKNMALEEIIAIIKEGKAGISRKIKTYRECIKKKGKENESCAKLKDDLPYFTTAGCFGKRRSKEFMVKYSNLTVLDIDDLHGKGVSIKEIKRRVKKIPESYVGFVSPGGNGYKIIVKLDTSAENHKAVTTDLMSFYQKRLKVKIDPSGKDLARPCFLSHDPDLYYNKEAKKFTFSHNYYMDKKIVQALNYTKKERTFASGSRNDFIFVLGCNLNKCGIEESIAIKFAIDNYSQVDFTEDEIIKTIRSGYKSSKNEKDVAAKYNPGKELEETKKVEKEELKNLEDEMGLNKMDLTEKAIVRLLFSALEDEENYDSIFSLATENSLILKKEFSKKTIGKIAEHLFTIKTLGIEDFLNNKSNRVQKLTNELLEIPFDLEKFDIIALRILILRFKVSKVSAKYNRIFKSVILLSSKDMVKAEKELKELEALNNIWVEQIRGLFQVYKDKRREV